LKTKRIEKHLTNIHYRNLICLICRRQLNRLRHLYRHLFYNNISEREQRFVFLLGGCHLARRGRRRWRSSETAALTQQQRNLDIFLYVIVIVLYVIKTTFDFQSPLIWKVVNFLLAFGNIASNLFRRSIVNIKINNQLESRIIYLRGLKLRETRGPHETQRKVSRATLKKAKKLPSNLQLKTKNSWKKIGKWSINYKKTAEFLIVRRAHWTLLGPRVWDRWSTWSNIGHRLGRTTE